MRAKGVVVTLPDKEPKGVLADEAKKIQKQKQERKIIAGRKPPRPVPNYICYSFLFPDYDPKTGKGCPRPLPKCRVCGYRIDPQEHHTCEGFKPKYPEYDEAWRERMEERREMIREAKRDRMKEAMEARREMIREARLNGNLYDECQEDWCDEDESYDDEDYCEGDDDGYDCE